MHTCRVSDRGREPGGKGDFDAVFAWRKIFKKKSTVNVDFSFPLFTVLGRQRHFFSGHRSHCPILFFRRTIVVHDRWGELCDKMWIERVFLVASSDKGGLGRIL